MMTQQHASLRFLGWVLLVLSVVGILHAGRATASYVEYFHIKFSPDPGEQATVVEKAERAHRLYAWNYLLCTWMAEQAWANRLDAKGHEIAAQVDLAERWCERGLVVNPHKGPLRLLKTRLLARESIAEAIDYWEAYVDWHFWDPYNHAVRVELCAEAGEFGRAMQALQWTKQSPKDFAWARKILDDAWAREMEQAPPEPTNPLTLEYRL